MTSTTPEPYHPKSLYDANYLDPIPPRMSAEEAQPWSNFVVFAPVALPAEISITESSVRQEAPPGRPEVETIGRTPWSDNNPAAFRMVISGEGRSLRIKQFLYDWAFPALDHPCLWESETTAKPLDAHHVLWLGRDYLGNRGASARMARTMIELSVLEGEFTDAELVELYQALQPVDPEALKQIESTSFAELSYFGRYPEAKVLGVPVGMWKPGQSDNLSMNWQPAGPRALGGLNLDSVAYVDDDPLVTSEEVYLGGFRRNQELRVHRFRRPEKTIMFEPSTHPGLRETVAISGRQVQLGWIDENVGPFDAIVADDTGQPHLRLLSSTGVGLNREWFERAAASLIE